MNKKVLAGIASMLMVASVGAMGVGAATSSTGAELYRSETVKYSGKIAGYGGYFSGSVSNDETDNGVYVHFIAKQQYHGIWIQDEKVTVNKGGVCPKTPTSDFKTLQHVWQLGLNPEGANKKNARASGSMTINHT